MKRPLQAATIAAGLLVVAVSLYYVFVAPSARQVTARPSLAPPSYVESKLAQLALTAPSDWMGPGGGGGDGGGGGGGGRPPRAVGGGCGSFRVLSAELVPVLIRPELSVSLGSNFIVGVRIQIQQATAERQRCIQDSNSFSTELRTDPVVQRIDLKDFSDDERKRLKQVPIQATLFLAGAEYAPNEPASVSEESPTFWSVRPASTGELKGWIRLESRTAKLDGQPQQSELLVSVSNATDAQAFSTEVRTATPSLGYILSVLGSIFGTLLASAPAWLAWLDKRRTEVARHPKSRIILP